MSVWLYYFLKINKYLGFFHNGWWCRLLHWVDFLLTCYGWWLEISIPGMIPLLEISLTVLMLLKQQRIVWVDWLLRGFCLQLWKCDLQLLFLVHHLSSLCSTSLKVVPSKVPWVQQTAFCYHPSLVSCPSSSSAFLKAFPNNWIIFSMIWTYFWTYSWTKRTCRWLHKI